MRQSVSALIIICFVFRAGRLFAETPLPVADIMVHGAALADAIPWQPAAPRAEICPAFSFDTNGGPRGDGALTITIDDRRGMYGCWQRTFDVKGGTYYRFTSLRKTSNVQLPRRSTFVRIIWQDDDGSPVPHDGTVAEGYLVGWNAQAEPEFPTDRPVRNDGWTEVSGVYRVPSRAARAVVELYLRW